MDAKKEAKLNMFHSVAAICDDNATIVSTVVAFQTSFNVFKTTLNAIVTTATQLEVNTEGLAVSKKKAKQNLAEFGSGLASIVSGYAATTGNAAMQGEMHITSSDILSAKDDVVTMICQNIYDTANANIGALASFGITPALLTAFSDAIKDYDTKAPKPRGAVNEKKGLREVLKTLYADADTLLHEQMDKMAVAATRFFMRRIYRLERL
jgi:hypothetical protein